MNNLRRGGLLAGLVLAILSPVGRAVDPEAVNKAIDKGVLALRDMQGPNGVWRYPEIGATALAGLTLLECGAAADDKAVLRAADAVRQASISLTHTYSIALAIFFFDRLGDPGDIPLIESLTVRLLAGQTANGGWNYNTPSIDAIEMRRLQATLGQKRELAGRRRVPKPGEAKRSAKDLPTEIKQQLAALRRLEMGGRVVGSDNSNTQFATLALWIARRYGLPVEAALKRVEARFRGSQQADGGWGYFEQGGMVGRMAASTASMTCAGLLGLAVVDGEAVAAAHERRPGAKATRDFKKDTNLRGGLIALSTVIGQPQEGAHRKGAERMPIPQARGRTYYFLWSLERVAVALDLKTIGKKDWYAWGAEILLANQKADGTWQGNFADCGADTCFALLFLKRANLVPDLTTQLTGKVQDPGERLLTRGGAGGDALLGAATTNLKSGIEGKDAKPTVEGKYPTPEADPKEAKPYAKPHAERAVALAPLEPIRPVESVSARMAADLASSYGSRHTQVLQQLREGRGADFTAALALAIPQLSGERQHKARTVLVERLTRMKVETLTNYLEDEDAEIRRAAALACSQKDSSLPIPKLIPLLRDSRREVAEAAHEALKTLTGEDHGPKADADGAERAEAVRRWQDWWDKRGKK